MWKKHAAPSNGTFVPGDHEAPRTRLWLLPYLLWCGWKKTAVFSIAIDVAARGYRVGYKAHDGSCRLSGKVLRDAFVRTRLGREGCTFFAIDANGNEATLTLEEIAFKRSPAWQGVPLV